MPCLRILLSICRLTAFHFKRSMRFNFASEWVRAARGWAIACTERGWIPNRAIATSCGDPPPNSFARSKRSIASCRKRHFAPLAVELPFGFSDKKSLPALELTTPKRRRVHFRGFIDRVDVAEVNGEWLGVVVDYKKTSKKKLSLGEVFHGLSLQLTAYLLALAKHGHALSGRPITPIAALYVRLEALRDTLAHPSDIKPREADFPEAFRPRGLIRFDTFDWLEPWGEEHGWATHFSMFKTKKGDSGYMSSTDAASEAEFDALLAHTKHKLGDLSDGILDGDVAVRPCRHGSFSPCTWCDFKSVCRFEMGLDPIVRLAKISRTEVLKRLQAAASGEDPDATETPGSTN